MDVLTMGDVIYLLIFGISCILFSALVYEKQ